MSQRFFIDQDGQFLGSYDGPDDDLPNEFVQSMEVDHPPSCVTQKWNFELNKFDDVDIRDE